MGKNICYAKRGLPFFNVGISLFERFK